MAAASWKQRHTGRTEQKTGSTCLPWFSSPISLDVSYHGTPHSTWPGALGSLAPGEHCQRLRAPLVGCRAAPGEPKLIKTWELRSNAPPLGSATGCRFFRMSGLCTHKRHLACHSSLPRAQILSWDLWLPPPCLTNLQSPYCPCTRVELELL